MKNLFCKVLLLLMQQEYDDEDEAPPPDIGSLSEEDFAAVFYRIVFACRTLIAFALKN